MDGAIKSDSLWKKLDELFLISTIFASRKMAAMLGLGFSAGLPILMVYTILSGWLRDVGISRSTIGFLVIVGFAYSLKFLWAPLVDRTRIPGFSAWLGNRRGWTLFAACGTGLAMLAMGLQDPTEDLAGVVVCAALLALASATLDICVDAWRVDTASNDEQAAMSAVYQLGYRFGMIAAVSGGMFIAGKMSFNATYIILGIVAFIGATTPIWAPDAKAYESIPISRVPMAILMGLATLIAVSAFLYFGMKEGGYLRWIGGEIRSAFQYLISPFTPETLRVIWISALCFVFALPFLGTLFFLTIGRRSVTSGKVFTVPIIGDFADIVRRTGWMALAVFAMVATYRISDTTMGVMAMPLYIDLGYDKAVIGLVKGLFGITMLIFGAFAGAWSAAKYGLAKTMIYGAILTIITNLAFAWLASVSSPKAIYLFVTIGADNIAAGFAGSVFIAFMSILTNKDFSASQYALFSSLFAFYGKSLAAFSGVLADKVEYIWFFIITAGFGIPALLLSIFFVLSGFTESVDEEGVAKSGL